MYEITLLLYVWVMGLSLKPSNCKLYQVLWLPSVLNNYRKFESMCTSLALPVCEALEVEAMKIFNVLRISYSLLLGILLVLNPLT